jgi:hypothetical protein
MCSWVYACWVDVGWVRDTFELQPKFRALCRHLSVSTESLVENKGGPVFFRPE